VFSNTAVDIPIRNVGNGQLSDVFGDLKLVVQKSIVERVGTESLLGFLTRKLQYFDLHIFSDLLICKSFNFFHFGLTWLLASVELNRDFSSSFTAEADSGGDWSVENFDNGTFDDMQSGVNPRIWTLPVVAHSVRKFSEEAPL